VSEEEFGERAIFLMWASKSPLRSPARGEEIKHLDSSLAKQRILFSIGQSLREAFRCKIISKPILSLSLRHMAQ